MGVHWRATVHADKSGKPAVLLGSMDELVLGQRIDSLTGLWNYDKCTEDLESAVLKEEGYFIVFGIDNFKHINVKNGRPFGNDVLKRMTESLEKNAWRLFCSNPSGKREKGSIFLLRYRQAGDGKRVHFISGSCRLFP